MEAPSTEVMGEYYRLLDAANDSPGDQALLDAVVAFAVANGIVEQAPADAFADAPAPLAAAA